MTTENAKTTSLENENCSCGHEHHAHTSDEQSGEGGETCACGHEHPGQDSHGSPSDDDEACSCGHEHHSQDSHGNHSHDDEACSCGHEHHSSDSHGSHSQDDEACSCGHEHHSSDSHGSHSQDDEACSCEHKEALPGNTARTTMPGTAAEKRIYILDHLDCANCAAKMEEKIRQLPGVESAVITYATKQLRISGDHPDELFDRIQTICRSIESGVTLTLQEERPAPRERKEETTSGLTEDKKDMLSILAGAAFFVAGFLVEDNIPLLSSALFLISYVILGAEIVWTAVKNIRKGNIFDENFLMSIATIGAICIGDFAEACGVMLFYRVGEWFEHRAVARSRSQIMDALDMRPETVTLVENQDTRVIPAKDARPGDILLVRPGDRIPLDGVVTSGESRIDTSPVTGEPVPVKAAKGTSVISGCMNTSGVLHMKVEKVLEESMVTKILDSVENAAASKPKIDRFITKFARIYTPIVVFAALATAVIPSLITGNWSYWIYTALSFLVISCPCALVLSVPLAFFSGIGAGSKKGILFKGGASLEALKNVKAVVMDKTGTITQGNFILQDITPAAGDTSQTASQTEALKNTLLSLAASCESASSHPIAISILDAAQSRKLTVEKPDQIEEISGHGIKAHTSEGILLCGNRKLMERFGVELSGYQASRYGTEVLLAVNGEYAGQLIIADTLKEDAASAITALKRQNIITAMLTGDAKESADAVAAQTGIDEVHARLLPEDKLTELKKIRNTHGSVMFVGDGINDAPVLAGADIGAAMGSGADAAIEAADVVFMTSSMTAIPESISIARITSKIAFQNVSFALAIKALVMVLGLAGYASMWFAVFADSGVAMLCVLNSIRILYRSKK